MQNNQITEKYDPQYLRKFEIEVLGNEERYGEYTSMEVAPKGTRQVVHIPEELEMVHRDKFPKNERALPCLPEKLATALRELSEQIKTHKDPYSVPKRQSPYQQGQFHEFITEKERIAQFSKFPISTKPNLLIDYIHNLRNSLTHNPSIELIAKMSYNLVKEELESTINFQPIFQRKNYEIPMGKLSDDSKSWGTMVSFLEHLRIKIGGVYHSVKKDFKTRQKVDMLHQYELHVTQKEFGGYTTTLMSNGKIFRMYHNEAYFCIQEGNNPLYAGLKTSLDYLVLISEYYFNLSLIKDSEEYGELRGYISALQGLPSDIPIYNDYVAMIKSTESLGWLMMDIDKDKVPTLLGLYGALEALIEITRTTNLDKLELMREVYYLRAKSKFTGRPERPNSRDWEINKLPHNISNLLKEMCSVPTHYLGGMASLHKIRGLKFIDLDEMMTKYASRVIKRYDSNQEYVRRLISLARKEVTIGFLKKHKKLPNMRLIPRSDLTDEEQLVYEETASMYSTTLKAAAVKSLSAAIEHCRDNSQWDYIEPYNCLFMPSEVSDIHYIMDKACSSDTIDFESDNNSKRAIISVCEEEDAGVITDYITYATEEGIFNNAFFSKKDFSWLVSKDPAVLREFHGNTFKNKSPLFTKQVAKEGEQNEGRVYAEAVERSKRALSRSMDYLKHAIDYIEGQVMTKSDRDRKMELHSMAQELIDKDKWAIMADISGHNQSMCPENCSELSEFLFNLYGLKGGWKLPHLFKNLKIFMKDRQTDYWFVAKGQYGAIEGWMNPLWGCQSALIMKLYGEEKGLKSYRVATYSDDILATFHKPDMTLEEKYSMILDMQKHFMQFGQLLKPTQTQLSGTRITLLKNHYVDGLYCASTIKRLCAVSTFHSSGVYSENAEVNGISSSISSAMEFSDQIFTIHVIKYIRTLLLCSVTIIRELNKVYQKKCRSVELTNFEAELERRLDPRYKTLLRPLTGYHNIADLPSYLTGSLRSNQQLYFCKQSYKIITVEPLVLNNGNYDLEFRELQMVEKLGFLSALLERYSNMYMVDFTGSMQTLFWKFHKDTSYIRNIIQTILLMPESVGGYGVINIQASGMTGYSHSKIKVINLLEKTWKRTMSRPEVAILKSWVAHFFSPDSESPLRKLLTSEFPTYQSVQTSEGITSNIIYKIINSNAVRNKFIKSLFQCNDVLENQFLDNLVHIFSEDFVYRFVRKYADLSHITLRQKYSAKFEHSRTILKLINKLVGWTTEERNSVAFEYFIKMWELPSRHLRFLLQWKKHDQERTWGDLPIDEYLIKVRNAHYSREVNFSKYYQPLVENYIMQSDIGSFVVIMEDRKKETHRGTIYNSPAYRYPVKPKYRKDDLFCEYYNDLRTFFVLDAVRFTKWMIASSVYFHEDETEMISLQDNAYIYACNYIIMQYTADRYADLEQFVMTPTGGLPAHRVNNAGLVDRSVIRTLPNDSGKFRVRMLNTLLDQIGGEDSNLDIDYLHMRVQFSFALHEKYGYDGSTHIILDWKSVDLPYYNVARSFLCKTTEIFATKITTWDEVVLKPTDKIVVKSISELLMTMPDYSHIYDFNLAEEFAQKYSPDAIWISYLSFLDELRSDPNLIYTDFTDDIKKERLLSIDHTLTEEKLLDAIKILDGHFHMSSIDLDMKADLYSCALAQVRRAVSKEIQYTLQQKYITREMIREMRLVASKAYNFFLSLLLRGYIELHISQSENEETYGTYTVDVRKLETKAMFERLIKSIKVDMKVLPTDRNSHIVLRCLDNQYISEIVGRVVDDVSKLVKMDCKFAVNLIDDMYKFNSSALLPTKIRTVDHNYILVETSADASIYHNWSDFQKLLSARRGLVGFYASLQVYDSPTYSDAYQTMLALVKYLKLTVDNLSVTDLTAGRGDLEIALSELSVDHVSYTLDNYYTKYHCSPNLLRWKYDVSDYDTIIGLDLRQHIIIDISYIESQRNDSREDVMDGLWWTLVKLLESNKTVIIRANSIGSPSNEVLIDRLSEYKCTLLSTSPNDRRMSPYAYLMIEPIKIINPEIIPKDKVVNTSYIQMLSSSFNFLRTLQLNKESLKIRPNERTAGHNKYAMCLNEEKIRRIANELRVGKRITTQFSSRSFSQHLNFLIDYYKARNHENLQLIKPCRKNQQCSVQGLVDRGILTRIGSGDNTTPMPQDYRKTDDDLTRCHVLESMSFDELQNIKLGDLHSRDKYYCFGYFHMIPISELNPHDLWVLMTLSPAKLDRKVYGAYHYLQVSTTLLEGELGNYPMSQALLQALLENQTFQNKYLGYLRSTTESVTDDLIKLAVSSHLKRKSYSEGLAYLLMSSGHMRSDQKLSLGLRYRLICSALTKYQQLLNSFDSYLFINCKFDSLILEHVHKKAEVGGKVIRNTDYMLAVSEEAMSVDNILNEKTLQAFSPEAFLGLVNLNLSLDRNLQDEEITRAEVIEVNEPIIDGAVNFMMKLGVSDFIKASNVTDWADDLEEEDLENPEYMFD